MNPKRYPFLIAFLLACVLAHAQVPQTLSYQGLLTDATGNPLNGTQSVTFNFYTVATGGTLAFSRGPLEVAAFQGLFTVILGNGQGNNNAGLPSLGSTQYYIGIRVGTATTDLSPRVQLTAVPYAFTASNLDPNATVSATQLTGTVPAERIAPSSIDDSKLVGISASKVTGNLPATQVTGLGSLASKSTVTVAEITDGAVTNAKLSTDIQATKINGLGTLATKSTVTNTEITGPISLANGGTGAANAPAARTSLGLGMLSTLSAISTTEITNGTIVNADIADGAITDAKITGSIDGSKIGTGINASNITSGILPFAQTPPTVGFSAVRTTGGSLQSQICCPITTQIVTFSPPTFNIGNAFSASSGLFTAPTDGWYIFNAQIAFTDATNQGVMYPYFQAGRNGTLYQAWHMNNFSSFSGSTRISGTIYTYLLAGDSMGVYIAQATGASINYSTDGTSFHFQGIRIGN